MTVNITGTVFAPNATGVVWFDTDGDWVFDPVEPSANVTADAAGAFSTNLTVPTVAPGTYFIRADVPAGAAVEAWASFTVAAPSIALVPTTGGPGTNVTVTGGNFSVGHTGRVWFDTDGDGVFDAGEPTVFPTPAVNATGGFSVTLPPVPAVAPATYFIRADVPLGGPVEASATFTLPPTGITLTPATGGPGTTVTVAGVGFNATLNLTVWFDTDGDGTVNPAEPSITTLTGAAGTFSVSLTVPPVPAGAYFIRADTTVPPPAPPALASRPFTVAAHIALNVTSGVPGTNVSVNGTGFTPTVTGIVWFDSDHDGALDGGEPFAPVTVDAAGVLPATPLTVPAVAPGTYSIRADAPLGGPVEASVSFTVPHPIITLAPTSGVPGTNVTVTGVNFTANATGIVWFDSDGDGLFQAGEPFASVTANATGGLPATNLTVPAVAPGAYSIRADVPLGFPWEASATFTRLPAPIITLTPTSGGAGTTVTVNGTGFVAGAIGIVWFDSDGDGVFDAGEPSASAPAGPGGAFLATLTVPAVVPGAYSIRADVPLGLPWEASATFTLPATAIVLTPPSGGIGTTVTVNGTGFTVGATGIVWFDSDGDRVFDAGEPSASVLPVVAGNFSVTLTVPAVAPGAYFVRADVPSGGPVEASATFTRLAPAITLTPASGGTATNVTVAGVGFNATVLHTVWFDTDGDGVLDPGEVPASLNVTTGAAGNFSVHLIVPTVAAGDYFIRADVPPPALPAVASATFTRLATAITLTPTTGAPGTTVTVAGVGFNVTTPGRVWFDTNHNGLWEAGELEVRVTTNATGAFSASLVVPTVAPATYFIRADVPTPEPAEASASFTIPVPPPPPPPPPPTMPPPAASGVPIRPAFQWAPVPGAVHYQFQISTVPGFVPYVHMATPTTPFYVLPLDLEHGTGYYWRVRAIGPGDVPIPPWVVNVFTTVEAPPPPPPPPPPPVIEIPPPVIELPPVVTPAWVWVLIAIGAVLVIVVIVLIFRTRRV
jgi:hypothetical protein